ncbi:MAG: VOC family protein [Hyphomonadaceae bacterium]|nr:VOC family protein [Hyphomonadaceae bacterium]MBX3511818.1 VOC family protein [Hyphomonadaceae bacterium]
MSGNASLFRGLGQIGVVSAKAGEVIAFYRDVMGFPVRFEAGGMTFMQAGEASLMIGAMENPPQHDVTLYFEPVDWNAAEAQLEAAGVQFEREAMVLQREETREHLLRPFRDPEGRPLYLLGWRPL